MGSSHSVPKEGGERLSDYLRREFKGKGFDADTLVVIALKDEEKEQQKDEKKRKGLWKKLTSRLSSRRSAKKHDKNSKGHLAAKTKSAECNTESVSKQNEKTAKEDVETPSVSASVIIHRDSSEDNCVDLHSSVTSSQSETPAAPQVVEPTPSTSSHIERRYLRSGESPVYQFNIPPRFDFRVPKSGVRDVRHMTPGTKPSWADKDFGSEPWEDDASDHTEEMSKDHSTNEISKNNCPHVGGWSDQTAYRVRGIAEELTKIALRLSADIAKTEENNDSAATSIVNNAQAAACRGRKRTMDHNRSDGSGIQEMSLHDEKRCDNLVNIDRLRSQEAASNDSNKIEHTALSHEVSCQTEIVADDSTCLNGIQKDEARNIIECKKDENGEQADTTIKEDVNSSEKKADNAVSVTSQVVPYSAYPNDKDIAYIAGILAAGTAYSIGNRTEVQKAAYLAGVRAVDAAYRMANETATSFANICVADSTDPVKDTVEAETTAYLAGIRAVEVAHRKAEETAYMKGVNDAKEVIHSKGKVENPISKGKETDISLRSGENLKEQAVLGKQNTCHNKDVCVSGPFEVEIPCKRNTNEKLENTHFEYKRTHLNHIAESNNGNEDTSEENSAPTAHFSTRESDTASKPIDKMLQNKKDIQESDKVFTEEADRPKHEKEKQKNVDNVHEINLINFPSKSSDHLVVNKKTGSGNDMLLDELNLDELNKPKSFNGGDETVALSDFGDSNNDVDDNHKTYKGESEVNIKEELLFDRGEECSDSIKEMEKMADMLFEQFVNNEKDMKSKEEDLSKSVLKNKTEKANFKDTYENNDKHFMDIATFDEMPIKKANSLLRLPLTEMEYAPDDYNGKEKTEVTSNKNDSVKNAFKDTSENNGKSFMDVATLDEMPIKKTSSLSRQPWTEMENTSEGYNSTEKTNAKFYAEKNDKEKNDLKGSSENNGKSFIDIATFDEMPIKKANSFSRQLWTEMEYASNGYNSPEKTEAKSSVVNTRKYSKMKNKNLDTECKQQSNCIPKKKQNDCYEFDKSCQEKTTPRKQDDKAEAFFVSFDAPTINTKQFAADEIDNNCSTQNIIEKPFVDMATFDEMPLKKTETLLTPPVEEIELYKQKLKKKVKWKKNENKVDFTNEAGTKSVQDKILGSEHTDTSNDISNDPCSNNTVSRKQSNTAEAFIVSFDEQELNKKDYKDNIKDDFHNTPNITGKPFMDMATFDEMPIKRADALLRPPGGETEFSPPNHFDKSKRNKRLRKKTKDENENKCDEIKGTNSENEIKSNLESKYTGADSIDMSNDIKHDTSESNNIDYTGTKSKSGAAEAFFVSFDPPAVDKGPMKSADIKKNIPDTTEHNGKPFINMATFDDMPIKKADALLRPFGEKDEFMTAGTDYITEKIDAVKTKVKRLVRKKGQYGTVEHNKLIESENAMKKEKIGSAAPTDDSCKMPDDKDDNDDIKKVKRPQKLFAKKAQYGSVAHNNQIKQGNEMQKKKLGTIKSSLDTWKTKEVEVSKKRAEYGSVEHNNLVKLENALKKKRMKEIHSNIDTWNAPNPGSKYSLQRKDEWEPVRDPGKYGSVAHFHQIKSNNAKRKKHMNNIQSSLDTWNRPNPGSMYSLKRKYEWAPVTDTKKYGSVAHYHQVKKTHGNNKQMIKGAGSRISTWQSKSKMHLLNASKQNSVARNDHSANKVSVNNTDCNIERNEFSSRQNDHRVPSWSRYGETARHGEYDNEEDDLFDDYNREETYQNYDAYPSLNNHHNHYRNEHNDELSFINESRQQKQSKIPKLVLPHREDTFSPSQSKGFESPLAYQSNHGDRYREVNPLTVDLSGDREYSHWQFPDSSRSWSRPLSCRSEGGSNLPVQKKTKIGTYKGLLQECTARPNDLRRQVFTRFSPREYD